MIKKRLVIPEIIARKHAYIASVWHRNNNQEINTADSMYPDIPESWLEDVYFCDECGRKMAEENTVCTNPNCPSREEPEEVNPFTLSQKEVDGILKGIEQDFTDMSPEKKEKWNKIYDRLLERTEKRSQVIKDIGEELAEPLITPEEREALVQGVTLPMSQKEVNDLLHSDPPWPGEDPEEVRCVDAYCEYVGKPASATRDFIAGWDKGIKEGIRREQEKHQKRQPFDRAIMEIYRECGRTITAITDVEMGWKAHARSRGYDD